MVLEQPGREPDLFWWAQTPDWFPRVVLMGLIGLIPFAGTMALFGWLLALRDNLVGSRWELPPPGFSYMERGLRVFAVFFVYGVAIFLTALAAGGVVLIVFTGVHLLVIGILGGFAVLYLVALALEVPLLYSYLAIFELTDRGGVTAALDPRRLFRHAYANNRESLIGAGVYVVGILAIVAVGSVLPLGSILAQLALPAVLATMAPGLARFHPETLPSAESGAGSRPPEPGREEPGELAKTLVLPPASP